MRERRAMSDFRHRHKWSGMWLALIGALVLVRAVVAGDTVRPIDVHLLNRTHLRRPVAIALAREGQLLLVANQRSGTVSLVDLKDRKVVSETPIGTNLSDLVAVVDLRDDLFLATDSATHQLHLLRLSGKTAELKALDSLKVSADPVSICAGKQGKRCFIASRWSRRLTIVELRRSSDGGIRLAATTVVPLAFPPLCQLLFPDGDRLLVADAFGGTLAIVNCADGRIAAMKTIPAHNIRGLAWSTDGNWLQVSHQTLSPLAHTTLEDIHWGSLVSNVLRSLPLSALDAQDADILKRSQLISLGDVGKGAADPAALVIAKNGTAYVALAGVGELAWGHLDKSDFRRVRVGIRPTALLADPNSEHVYVADSFGDSIFIFERPPQPDEDPKITKISLGPQPALSAADRGERLFFDARLSHDNWMSCHSCHADGSSGDLTSDTLGDGSFGAPKRIPPLGGVSETGPWAWNGSMNVLASQVRKSVETTMHGKTVTDEEINDLVEYLKTLKPSLAIDSPHDEPQQAAVERGRALFRGRGCDRCHVPPTYTSPHAYDVGLKDELGQSRFNPPSLRGVGQRRALFHDGRAKSLNDVFVVYRHPSNAKMSIQEVNDLVAFLRSI